MSRKFLLIIIMLGLIKKKIIVLLTCIVNGCNHTKCVSLTNQKCKIQPTLINLHSNEYSQEFHYYPFVVKVDRCAGGCNTLNDLSNKVCVPNKTEELNLNVFNMITGINGNYVSCECKCKSDRKKCDSNRWWNIKIYWCKCKNHNVLLIDI